MVIIQKNVYTKITKITKGATVIMQPILNVSNIEKILRQQSV